MVVLVWVLHVLAMMVMTPVAMIVGSEVVESSFESRDSI
jgi:hypothetical protein